MGGPFDVGVVVCFVVLFINALLHNQLSLPSLAARTLPASFSLSDTVCSVCVCQLPGSPSTRATHTHTHRLTLTHTRARSLSHTHTAWHLYSHGCLSKSILSAEACVKRVVKNK